MGSSLRFSSHSPNTKGSEKSNRRSGQPNFNSPLLAEKGLVFVTEGAVSQGLIVLPETEDLLAQGPIHHLQVKNLHLTA